MILKIKIQRGEKEIITIKFNKDIIEKTSTATIIRKNDKLLITRRKKYSRLEPNNWDFPRGKVEPNEISEKRVIRKVKEKLGITISFDKFFFNNYSSFCEK